MEKLVAISASNNHTLVLDDKGKVFGVGKNDKGQLGVGDTKQHEGFVELETLTDIEAIVAGAYTSLALDKNGNIYIWGQNLNFSRVGPDNRTAKLILIPQIFPYLNDVNQIAICNLTAYALVENGWPYGWGMCDEGGQLGARRRYPSSMPIQILGPPPLEYIATGDTHVLGLDKDGVLWTWGDNSFGQRGMTSYEYTANPTILRLPFSCLAIAAGKDHSLVLSQDGDVFAWGRSPTGEAGEINDHERLTNFRPQKIKGLPKISSIATGNFCSFAKSDNKEIWGWGRDIGPVPKTISLSLHMESLVFSKGSQRIPSIKETEKLIRLFISNEIAL